MDNEQFRKQVSENEDTAIKLLNENVKLKHIIEEVREYVSSIIIDETYSKCILEILDKESK